MRLFSYKDRPVHLGRYPAERLKRGPLPNGDASRPARPAAPAAGAEGLTAIARDYLAKFGQFRDGEVAGERAPIPDDPQALADNLKASCYFLDASVVGVCAAPAGVWYASGDDGRPLTPYHGHAVVILVEHGRMPEHDNPAAAWIGDGMADAAALRAAEIAVVLAGYIRRLGHSARAHASGDSDVDHDALIVRAGLGQRDTDGAVVNPYLGRAHASAVVTTDLALAPDRPLAPQALSDRRLATWLGAGGTRPGFERWLERRRPSHMSRYPMERIKRVDEPTTLILEDEVPRVSKRAAFFERALRGDLGDKARRERTRFAIKHPFAHAMTPLLRDMVGYQDGAVVSGRAGGTEDAAANSRAVKSLSYFLGADLVGICEAKAYTWYSHDSDGKPIEPKHKYAIVLLIDQGHETMEGASGDDWISGAQSMRAYLRGAEICGVMAALIRELGYGARAQTNLDSDVLQIPLILEAGLGELSRIGELVLNPFVGPRFKSAVVTTDLPLVPDRPIDFGLQDMCNKCLKCARECPCDAISYGDKVMFNGYEMWKPDVERCTRYRVTNPYGSACGRCMKTCPYNHEGLLMHRAFLWLAIHLPFTRGWIARLDDWARNGSRNTVKRWWFDLELLPDGRSRTPKGVNERDLAIEKGFALKGKQKIAYYHADAMPPPDRLEPVAIDRKAALAAADCLETPAEARARRARGAPAPAHYRATPPVGDRLDDAAE